MKKHILTMACVAVMSTTASAAYKQHVEALVAKTCLDISEKSPAYPFGAVQNTCGYPIAFTYCFQETGGVVISAKRCPSSLKNIRLAPNQKRGAEVDRGEDTRVYSFVCKSPSAPAGAQFIADQGINARCPGEEKDKKDKKDMKGNEQDKVSEENESSGTASAGANARSMGDSSSHASTQKKSKARLPEGGAFETKNMRRDKCINQGLLENYLRVANRLGLDMSSPSQYISNMQVYDLPRDLSMLMDNLRSARINLADPNWQREREQDITYWRFTTDHYECLLLNKG